jgi:inosose dehydratase
MTHTTGFALLPFEPGAWHGGTDDLDSIKLGFRTAKEAGFDVVEGVGRLSAGLDMARRSPDVVDGGWAGPPIIRTDMDFLHRYGRLIAFSEEFDLPLTTIYGGAEFINPRTQEAELDAARVIARIFSSAGIKYFCMSPPARRPGRIREDIASMAKVLNVLGAEMRELGVQLMFHAHAANMVEQPEEIDEFFSLADADAVGFLLDTAHIAAAGADPVQMIRDHAGRIGYVHFKDIEAIPGVDLTRGGAYRKAFRDVGDGNVDFAGALAALDENGYDGPIIAELDISPDPVQSVWKARRFFDSLGL